MSYTLKLITFPGAPNLPLFIAQDEGLFAQRNLTVEHAMTPSSIFQFEQIASGRMDVAGTAFDNVVAYREHQGAADLPGPLDVHAFMGASQIELTLVAQPEVKSVADLAGCSLAMDALDTGFAFVAHAMLEHAGVDPASVTLAAVGATPQRFESVRAGDHAATLTLEPFTAMARASGLNLLDSSAERFEHYQGGVFATRDEWAAENQDAITAFVEAYLEALAMTLDEDNVSLRRSTLMRHMPNISPTIIDGVISRVVAPRTGLTPKALISRAGVETVLGLRRKHHPNGAALGDASPYLRAHGGLEGDGLAP